MVTTGSSVLVRLRPGPCGAADTAWHSPAGTGVGPLSLFGTDKPVVCCARTRSPLERRGDGLMNQPGCGRLTTLTRQDGGRDGVRPVGNSPCT